jgi:indolepyruvate ferredoxin oxidoreductase beta subunit
MANTKNVLIVGVGGQGVLLASRILSRVLTIEGFDVKVSEVHGMAQRGGSVHSMVRYGEKIYSPLIPQGEADYILSFELLETLRWVSYTRSTAKLIVNEQRIDPLPVAIGQQEYPHDVIERLRTVSPDLTVVQAQRLALEAGNVRTVNLVLLGGLAREMPFVKETWNGVIRASVPPKTVDVNLRAFQMGLELN